jgi:hypothetical protein
MSKRNPIAKAVKRLRPLVVRDRSKYTRKLKHKDA